ncbi:MAG: hypothetical protein R2688_09065 [Fimbriimonadaceae bacterium]
MSLGAGFSGGPSRKGDKGLNYSLVQTLKMAWADDELRARLRFLLLVFGLYVLGVHVPVPIPGISTQALEKLLEGNQFFNLMNTVGGGAFKRYSIGAWVRALSVHHRLHYHSSHVTW